MMEFDEAKDCAKRLLEMYRFNVRKRLMPQIVRVLSEAWKFIDARAEEADRDHISEYRFSRLRSIYLTNAILSDSVASSAFGYRMNQSTRLNLVHVPDLKAEKSGRNIMALGIPFHVLVLERAGSYLAMARLAANATSDDPLLALVDAASRDVSKALAGPEEQPVNDYPRIFREDNELLSYIMYLLPAGGTDDVERALWCNPRVLVDIPMEAALWLLQDVPVGDVDAIAPPSARWKVQLQSEKQQWLLEFVENRIQRMLAETEPFEDPMTFFWAIAVLARHNPDKAANYLAQHWQIFSPRLAEAFTSRAWFPATPRLPEIAEDTCRSECLALLNLCSLPAEVMNVPAAASIVETWKQFLLVRIVEAACNHKKRNTGDGNMQCADEPLQRWLPGGAIAPSSLHVLSMYIWALSSWQKTDGGGAAAPAPSTPDLDIGTYRLKIEDVVRHATEINIADHRLFGDYLIWNKESHDPVAGPNALKVRNEIQSAVRAYFASDARRPLNILVCASPGSGKSFFVKNVLKDLKETRDLELIESNATQLRSPEALYSRLKRVTSQIAAFGKAAFFLDEVDAPLGDGYFFSHLLGPMWDGEYPIDGETLSMNKTVWFFAASAGETPDKFEEWLESRNVTKREDYVSRLSLKVELPHWTREASLLTFLGNLRRIHKNRVTHVSRGVLDFFATHTFNGGARVIEKCVLMLGSDGGHVDLSRIPESYRRLATANADHPLVEGAAASELVSIVDF